MAISSAAGILTAAWSSLSIEAVPLAPEPITFSKNISPIIYGHCAVCHHPGGAAPISLLTYSEVKKHASQIVELTKNRRMPPWPPEHGYGEFAEERRLEDDEIRQIEAWTRQGAVEGSVADRPPAPTWREGWLLGRPDLVVALPQAYHLVADGKDVYRNFVLSVPVATQRYVRALEFRPGNPQVVHHAFIKVDRTRQSRRLNETSAEPGFAGMNTPAEMPDGQFLTWQPGKLYSLSPTGLAWHLDPGNDLVLQMHLRPSGKAEVVQPSVALYFTDQKPTNTCFKMALTSLAIDIPAGQPDYLIEDSFVLPVEADALAVLPHAHYLGKRMEAWASLPDGRKQWLLFIRDWDFSWQGDYRFARPMTLPKGSILSMRYSYDNSTNNLRNPHQPPRRVTYGPQSDDEMAELWLQLLPHSPNDAALLVRASQAKTVATFIRREEYLLGLDPSNEKAHTKLAQLLSSQGRTTEALDHLHAASRLNPDDDDPHYALGLIFRSQNRFAEARTEFETALRLNARNSKAHGNLGVIAAAQGDFSAAEAHFRAALEISPDDEIARASLAELLQAKGALPQRR